MWYNYEHMFLNPEKFVEYCDAHLGMKVADLGASIGQYAIPLAKRVGGGGKVYAVDIQKDLLLKLKSEATKKKISNIEIVWGDIETVGGTKLKNESVDRVFIINTTFQINDKSSLIYEIKRILKKKGKVIYVDWQDSFGGLGPHPDNIITSEMITQLFEKGGFIKECNLPSGDHHYGILFIKQHGE